jgi:hypothetical protein
MEAYLKIADDIFHRVAELETIAAQLTHDQRPARGR